MNKYRGPVFEMSQVESGPAGWMIRRIRVGATTLRNVNCDDILAGQLQPDDKREVCLYVTRLPMGAVPYPFSPHLLGVKYVDTGEKHVIPFSFARNSFIRFAVIPALVWSIGGGVAGAIIATLLGFAGVTNLTLIAAIPGLAFFGGLILAWWCSLRIGLDYVRARVD